MAFTLKNYIKQGLIAAVGKMADYQIILNAAGWLEKGVLSEDDLMEIQAAVQQPIPEPTAEDRIAALEEELKAAKILLGLEE